MNMMNLNEQSKSFANFTESHEKYNDFFADQYLHYMYYNSPLCLDTIFGVSCFSVNELQNCLVERHELYIFLFFLFIGNPVELRGCLYNKVLIYELSR